MVRVGRLARPRLAAFEAVWSAIPSEPHADYNLDYYHSLVYARISAQIGPLGATCTRK